MAQAEGRVFNYNPNYLEEVKPDLLEVFRFDGDSEQLITIEYPEFSAVCPFSGLPDIAKVIIKYKPTANLCIELKSLKYYFLTYRNAGIYQEAVTSLIRKHLEEKLGTDVLIKTIYNTRGGIDVECIEGQVCGYKDGYEAGLKAAQKIAEPALNIAEHSNGDIAAIL